MGVLTLQCYVDSTDSLPAGVPDYGGIDVCDDCSEEVAELLASWVEHRRPPVGTDHSIAEGYRRVADECSFCADSFADGPALGVELYRAPSRSSLPEYANYSLCHHCLGVFEQFLDAVGESDS